MKKLPMLSVAFPIFFGIALASSSATVLMVLHFLQVPSLGSPPPIPVTTGTLAMWLAFATPVSVASLGVIQVMALRWAANTSHRQTKKIDEIHIFTNSALGAAYRSTATALRLLANQTNTLEDRDAAERAERVANDHDASQRSVNAHNLAVADAASA
jgi:hypothetical protein